MNKIFVLLNILLAQFVSAQVSDNFTDGDYTANPVWTPSVPADFVVTANQLQSNNTTASSTFYISTPSSTSNNCQWEFFVNLKFATSGANYVDAYLTADNSDLSSAALSGYFVRIGNTSDDISLYKNVAGTPAILIDGINTSVNSATNNLIKIKVTRDAADLFTLERDMTGTGTSYVSEGTITDATFTTSSFFGFLIKQSTASFFQKHFFDDIYAGAIITDTNPPVIVSATPLSSTTLDVLFDEDLDPISSQVATNYSADNGLGNPSSAVLDGANAKLVHLTFATAFTNGLQNTLTVNAVQDLLANPISNGTATFLYLVFSTPTFKDVIINEIMVDVNPVPSGVPARQYLEVYNRSANYFDLNGWQFSDAVSTTTIASSYTFAPNSYVLIAKSSDTVLFTGITNKIGTATFPTYNTSGDDVYLKDNLSTVIDSINYTTTWYNDVVKDDGGWSLELINPLAPVSCSDQSNWIASNNLNGGTPGVQNSVYNTTPDAVAPQFVSITVIDSVTLQLCFNEAISSSLITVSGNYIVNGGIGSPAAVVANGSLTCATLSFATPFASAVSYTVSFSTLTDCSGNFVTPSNAAFTYIQMQSPVFNDVVINEIMIDVNPVPVGVPAKQYLEIYNKSTKYFNLNGWQFEDAVSVSTISTNYILAPDTYVLIAKASDTSLFTGITNKIGTSTFPTYNTTGDPVYLKDNIGNVLDSISYTTAWYKDAAKDDGGWSLELINPALPATCIAEANWTASNNANGGTPGVQNSVYNISPDVTAPISTSATPLDSVTLQICFNEAMDPALLSNPANYSVSNGIGSPASVVVNTGLTCATLTFAASFVSSTTYTVTFATLGDCSGNVVVSGNAQFTYIQTQAPVFGEVIINEIMVDVNPVPVGVPAKQYLEIYNKSTKYFNLNGWEFADAASTSTIVSSYTLAPNSYVVIAKSTDTSLFTGITNKIGTATFPSYNVTSDPVYLYDNVGNVLDSINYTNAWYNDATKDDGGWSLELINPTLNANCLDQSNWTASNNANGGTPGVQNSVYDISPDVTAPLFSSIAVIDSLTLEVCFNEAISATLINSAGSYSVNSGIGNPASVVVNNTLSCATLLFSTSFVSQTTYTLSFGSLADCSGNVVSPGSSAFTYIQTQNPSFNDVVVTELMIDVNPVPVGVPAKQYLELYNKSTKYFSLNNWQISDKVSSSVIITNYIFAPNAYILITKLADTSLFVGISNKIGTSTFPGYNTTGDGVYIQDALGNYVDSLNYDDSWYRNSVKDDGGWSLELINPTLNVNCEASENWIASNDADGGTPGTQNSVYNITPDVTAPYTTLVSVTDSLHITVCFNEGISSNLIGIVTNYSVSNGIGTPVSAVVSGTNSKCVDLLLANPLQNQTNYVLTMTNLADCSGNLISPDSINFSHYIAKPYDVVINELFADPDPPVGLPTNEYIELYNKTAYAISLKDWKLTVGNNDIMIPDAVIQPDSFVVLIDDASLNAFINEGYGAYPLIVLNGMSSSELNVSDEDVIISDKNNNVISFVHYYDSWYGDVSKESGGWSLEQIDPLNPCAGAANWRASVNVLGGTPGNVNSVNASNPDNTAPQLVRVNVISTDTIVAVFNESMQYSPLLNLSAYSISNGIGTPISITPKAQEFTQCIIKLAVPLQATTIYTLTVTNTLYDCAGNAITTENTARFGLPQGPLAGDVVINELLFNPKTDGVDYVELYNNSSKIIDLYDVYIGEGSATSTIIVDSLQITTDGYQLFPGEYVALSKDGNAVKSHYTTPNPKWFLDCAIPAMNTTDDIVVIADINGNEIDKVAYSDNMHFALLNDLKGVSLERIDFNRPSSDKTNWNSASANVGFGTPAYRNSQYMQTQETGTFSVEPEIFSPDNDGYQDVVTINYLVESPGLAGNVTIYDSKGVLIRRLVKNENLAISGSYSWNGITEQNEKAPIGIYIIYFETFSTSGDVQKHKLTCVLAGKL
ncbi:MAG: lamin tail domain-containing protein [Bacteroidota bacterium]|nr:lamin tail domain-containing protein [Bacteroidota bacterium]